MNTKACPQCKGANLASAVLCVTCGARLAGPPQVPAPGLPQGPPDPSPPSTPAWPQPIAASPVDPPAPPMPPGATVQYWGTPTGSPPVPRRRRSFLVPILGLVAAAVISVGVLSILDRGGSLPGEIDGLERIHSADASTFEDTMAAQGYGDITMEGGMYGEGDRPLMVVGLISHLPQSELQAPLEFVFDQGAGGFAGTSGGTVDSSGALSTNVAGVDYRCASFEVPGPVAGAGGHGSMCMWLADDLGFIITFRTADPSAAFADVRSAYDAIHVG